MQLISNLQTSINRIFELYRTQGKRHYAFSMVFTICTSIFSLLIAAILLFAYYSAHAIFSIYDQNPWERLTSMVDLAWATLFVTILNMALYSLFLHRMTEKPEEKISFSSFFASIQPETWLFYCFALVIGIFANGFLSDLIIDLHRSQSGQAETMGRLLSEMQFRSPLLEWFLSIGQLALQFLPVALAFVMIRRQLIRQGVHLERKQVRTAFWTVLMLSYAVFILSGQLISFVRLYVIKLIMIPFQEMLIPGILSIALYIFLLGIFYPSLAASLLFPFLYEGKKSVVLSEETPIDEL